MTQSIIYSIVVLVITFVIYNFKSKYIYSKYYSKYNRVNIS